MFTHFIENKLISKNESKFKPGNPYVNQLLAITHETFSSFDDSYEVTRVFLDIWKAFNKVCDEGIIHKVKPNGISRNLISIFIEILRNRKQRVAFNAQDILGLISVLVHLKILQ